MESKDKIKVGDKVRVIAYIHGHQFSIGDVVEIVDLDEETDTYDCKGEKGIIFYLGNNEFELMPTEPSDLISRTRIIEELCEIRDAYNYIVINSAIERIKNLK